jgi:hypothetical protein
MSDSKKRIGRVQEFDPEYVRSIAYQWRVAKLNERPDALLARIGRDPLYVSRLYSSSLINDRRVRSVLRALESLPCPANDLEAMVIPVARFVYLDDFDSGDRAAVVRTWEEERIVRYSAAYRPSVSQILAAKKRVDENDPATLNILEAEPADEDFL